MITIQVDGVPREAFDELLDILEKHELKIEAQYILLIKVLIVKFLVHEDKPTSRELIYNLMRHYDELEEKIKAITKDLI